MNTYTVTIPFAGYVRGEKRIVIEAETEEECYQKLRDIPLYKIPSENIRDDTYCNVSEACIEDNANE
jgi:hypothetical protein